MDAGKAVDRFLIDPGAYKQVGMLSVLGDFVGFPKGIQGGLQDGVFQRLIHLFSQNI
jgi:hypothetical protein